MQENPKFLTNQIMTYLGNKRKLLSHIEKEVISIKTKLNKEKLTIVDLFSGTGVVSRMFKQHAQTLIVNDLELYSKITNECYLTNHSDFNKDLYLKYYQSIQEQLKNRRIKGLISQHYAPNNDQHIQKGERVFYTSRNAETIDTLREAINHIPNDYQKYFLGPLIYQASVHNNTGGIFKGFYKDSLTGIGRFGGNGEHALKRIKGDIKLIKPIFSEYECDVVIHQEDANSLIKELDLVDVIYIDPPYNQHPYGSNYFMLNLIIHNKIEANTSRVSGIPNDWNRSDYNKKHLALASFESLIKEAHAKYLLISYNSEGFITYKEMKNVLSRYGELTIREIKYNAYKASRNLNHRNMYVHEYLFILEKN